MNNRYFAALTLGGLVFFAACGTDSPQTTDETFFDDTATVAPITPAPTTTTDPLLTPNDTALQDTAAFGTTAPGATTEPATVN